MEIICYKIENGSIIQSVEKIEPEDWAKEIDWILIRTDDRHEVSNYFRKKGLLKNIADWIDQPENFPFSTTSGKTVTLNIGVSNATDIYKTDYLSLVLEDKLLITIVPQTINFFNERNLSMYSKKNHSSLLNFLFDVLAIKILAQNNINISLARNRIQKIEKILSSDPEEISSNAIIECERDINQLADIIEDQYLEFEILFSINSTKLNTEDSQHLNNTFKGFEPLNKAMLRLEKKAEALRLQYMLIQQEKSTRKINLLTIIQAVFVPLTFIAGVYGMNFVNIPELNWEFGYFLVWIVFLVMAAGLLSYFYKKGWFD